MSLDFYRGYTYTATFIWVAGNDYSNIHRQIIAKLQRDHSVPSSRVDLGLRMGVLFGCVGAIIRAAKIRDG